MTDLSDSDYDELGLVAYAAFRGGNTNTLRSSWTLGYVDRETWRHVAHAVVTAQTAQEPAQGNTSGPVDTSADTGYAILGLQREVAELKARLTAQEAWTQPLADAKVAGQQALDLGSRVVKVLGAVKKGS